MKTSAGCLRETNKQHDAGGACRGYPGGQGCAHPCGMSTSEVVKIHRKAIQEAKVVTNFRLNKVI